MTRCAYMACILIAFVCPLSTANVINIPGDYGTIQQGINASSAGDTVLVQPGTFMENIDFNGHNITVASLYLINQDDDYISNTIIDGNESGSVVRFISGENCDARIIGFTLRNGFAFEGGGIRCRYSSPTISNNIITENGTFFSSDGYGGGIFCYESDPHIIMNTIYDNESFCGGGIYCYDSDPLIKYNYIADNYGGI